MREQKYAKAKREPLGKSIMRNYIFPDSVKEENFRYGVDTNGGKLINFFFSLNIFNLRF